MQTYLYDDDDYEIMRINKWLTVQSNCQAPRNICQLKLHHVFPDVAELSTHPGGM